MAAKINRRHFLQGLAAAGASLTTPLSMATPASSTTLRRGTQAPTPIWPGGVEKPLMPYTPAIKAGGWLFIAGQSATDFETGVAPQARSDGSVAEGTPIALCDGHRSKDDRGRGIGHSPR